MEHWSGVEGIKSKLQEVLIHLSDITPQYTTKPPQNRHGSQFTVSENSTPCGPPSQLSLPS